MVKALIAKNYQKTLLKKMGICSYLSILKIISYLFNLRHTTAIENINV